ncbi:M56 family metallopeptidase [Salinimicrobium xinjiangense]|uniref:M56 family metallopeptidase n=1 Tax=Salinimicrobium xinjiangense TaxID=438596 RepID=UPI000419415D|nr:M56 family metallopeptidase [Salinimicrobium xinjiangense]
MEMYLLKSAACLAILILFYKLLLEKENMHVFKRFYLLAVPVISFGIPAISFPEYITVSSEGTAFFSTISTPETTAEFPLFEVLLSSLYILGVLFFGSRFLFNLSSLLKRAKKNPKIKAASAIHVLLKEEVIPHTFWSYIYLNRKRFETKQIPQEVLDHELAHVRQKHSADILFMEILQVLLWFLPFIYLLKKAVKLNHEFLADSAVLRGTENISLYQQMLLSFSSGEQNELVNSINYQSIKKRFTVMKKQPSQKAVLLRTFIFLPLLAVLLYSFSGRETVLVEKDTTNNELLQEKATPEMVADYNLLAQKYNSDWNTTKVTFIPNDLIKMQEIYKVMTPEQKRDAEPYPKIPEDYNYQKIATPEMVKEYNELAKMLKNYNKKSNNGQSLPKDLSPIKIKEIKRMRYLHSIMTEEQKEKAEPLPGIYPPPPPPPTKDSDNSTPPQQINFYDLAADGVTFYHRGKPIDVEKAKNLVEVQKTANLKLPINGINKVAILVDKTEAKEGNKLSPERVNLYDLAAYGAAFYYKGKTIDVEKARELVEVQKIAFIELPIIGSENPIVKLTDKKGSNSQSTPPPPAPTVDKVGNVPAPPPPPPPVPSVTKEGNVPPPPTPPTTQQGEIPLPPPPPPVPQNVDVPMPPPPPPSPIEAMKNWMEEGAEFYLNGKKVTGEKAFEVVKENNGKNLSVQVEENASGKTVRLSDNKR